MSSPYYATLFYGINIGRVPRERRNLPKEVFDKDEINIDVLEELISKYELNSFVDEYEIPTEATVHIGETIRSAFVYGKNMGKKSRIEGELPFFDIEHIINLRNEPSTLIAKLKKIGLEVRPEDLCLYGDVEVD